MKLRYIALAAALLPALALHAQEDRTAGGRLIRMADFSYSDMLTLAQYDYSMGTARTAAMGGAFASLGADLSSMFINPAGLGMYRSSEFGVSPSLSWSKTSAGLPKGYQGGGFVAGSDNTFTRFAPGNIGIALNTLQSSHGLVSFTFGFGYNKIADFNYNTSFGLDGQPSISEVFANQLYGVNPDYMDGSKYASPELNFRDVNMWGAVAGFRAWAVDLDKDNYPPDGKNDAGDYVYKSMRYGDADNWLNTQSVGSIGEYDISAGMNFNNVFYLGFSLGIQDIYQRQYAYYDEAFADAPASLGGLMKYMQYDQYMQMSGSGVNFKLGMIFRPIEPLRIGVAVHTPTFVSLDREYQVMNLHMVPQDRAQPETKSTILNDVAWTYTTPTRLLAGLSYQFGNVALLSADWEHVWYNGMRLGSPDVAPVDAQTRSIYKHDIKYSYKGADNFRAGVEIKPIPALALRAGYAFYGSPINTDVSGTQVTPSVENGPYAMLDLPVADKVNSYSAGLGFRSGGFSADVAYVYSKTDYTQYGLYWYDGLDNDGVYAPAYGSGPLTSSLKRSLVTLTLGFRF